MGVAYGGDGVGGDGGTGNDPVANMDDEYAVTPTCRYDDDGPGAGNEWRGAWRHTDPRGGTSGDDGVNGGGTAGKYLFEMSKSLRTPSADTDAQLGRGGAVLQSRCDVG